MKSMQGLLHTTTLQTARNQDVEHASRSVTSTKRSLSLEPAPIHETQTRVQDGGAVKFQRTISLPSRGTPRLTASRISASAVSEPGVSEYSQRRHMAATPGSSRDPELSLDHPVYGLPPRIAQNFASLGITQIYPWQRSCLKGSGLLDGVKNLVYCAPTGGGKSLVADVLMLKRVLAENRQKALLVLPYVALVQEKVRWLRRVVEGFKFPSDPGKREETYPWRTRLDERSIRVVGFFGGGKVRATWHDFDIAVCTMEKANALINQAVEDCTIKSLRAVVLDELHMVDDDHRGYLLELIAAKVQSLDQPLQIVGMSATMPNKDLLARWLQAHSYETLYRPVPIEEHLVCNNLIYSADSLTPRQTPEAELVSQVKPAPLRQVDASPHKEFRDDVLNVVVALACETAMTGFGVLVFAGSRNACEMDAQWISRVMPEPKDLDPSVFDKRLELLNDIRSLSTGPDPVLDQTVMYGVAFHHAGMTTEERELIAAAYDNGAILVCVATCSLAAGINLPARRVILHNARMGREFVGPALLRQMRGRAGRQGKVPVGETYLCCRPDDLDYVVELMHAELPEVTSCLMPENRRMQRVILEVIGIRLATSESSLSEYFSKSLIAYTRDSAFIEGSIRSSLAELEEMRMLERGPFSEYSVTQLGKAVVASGIDPYDGLFISKEVARALKAFVMDGEMHILYMFTPVQNFGAPVNWQVFRNEMEVLDESGMRVLAFLGIKPTVIIKLAQGASLPEATEAEQEVARVYRRFYVALQLRDLCNEMPIHMVARKYDTPRGTIQTLSQTCQGFAAGMIKFCETMGWSVMSAVLDHFSDRLMGGARADLLELTKVAFIKSRTARVFWENGYRTVAALATADPKDLLPILLQAQPQKIRLKGRDSQLYEEKLLGKAHMIAMSANRIWQMQMQAATYEE